MSLEVFNNPLTMAWDSTKIQKWDTKIQKSGSGRRKTLSRWAYPEWEISCSYKCLSTAEIEAVAGFFASMRGSFQPFLWKDPEDYIQTGVQIGTGDGVTTGFQLLRNLGGLFVEPVLDIVPDTLILYADDVEIEAYDLEDNGWAEFDAPPALGAVITADFEYYWRVAFKEDDLDYVNFWYDFYKLNKIKLVTVK